MIATKELAPFEEVNLFYDEAAESLGLNDGIREMLRRPWRELGVQVPVRMDDGRIEVFKGYRVQHNGARGPYKGGIRYHPQADQDEVRALASPTSENLRRVAWHPQGDFALIVGNGGTVLRYQDGALTPVPGDRAHTLRAIAWRPDGAYALVGAYASRWAGYPRPHPLYKCDGLYLQALLATDEEDDFVAVDWHPSGRHALIVGYAFGGTSATPSNKLLIYDGAGFAFRAVEASGSLLGAAWHPGGDYALLCGEGGALLRVDASTTLSASGERIEQLVSGTQDNLVGPFWRPDPDGQRGSTALLLRGPKERVYTV